MMPLLMSHFSSHTSVKVYMVLYHEAVLCNLLEVLLYHDRVIRDLSDSSQNGKHSTDKADALIELVDYCYRKLTLLNIGTFKSFQEEPKPSSSKALNSTTEEEVTRHKLEMEFNTSMSSLTILRFITDHTEVIPLSITVRLLQTHDVVLSLVPLIASPPWQRYRNGM